MVDSRTRRHKELQSRGRSQWSVDGAAATGAARRERRREEVREDRAEEAAERIAARRPDKAHQEAAKVDVEVDRRAVETAEMGRARARRQDRG